MSIDNQVSHRKNYFARRAAGLIQTNDAPAAQPRSQPQSQPQRLPGPRMTLAAQLGIKPSTALPAPVQNIVIETAERPKAIPLPRVVPPVTKPVAKVADKPVERFVDPLTGVSDEDES